MDELISINEAANRFAVTPRTIRQWIADGKIEAYRLGGRVIRIDVHSLYSLREPVQYQGEVR